MNRLGRLAAWAVHAYTAAGAVCALMAAIATLADSFRVAFAWLALQVFIDATDGYLARSVRVSERLPHFSGAHLDDIVDYLTYVFVPALMVWHAPLVPEPWRVVVPAAILLSSAFGFSRSDAKTADHFFTGFPSYWNIVVFYFVAWKSSQAINAVLLVLLAVLVFVPVKYIYPSRTVAFMRTTLALGITWAALMLLTLVWLAKVPTWLLLAGIVFPVYYVALSLWLRLRGESSGRRAAQGRGPYD